MIVRDFTCCEQAADEAAKAPERSHDQQVEDAVFMKIFIPKTLNEVNHTDMNRNSGPALH